MYVTSSTVAHYTGLYTVVAVRCNRVHVMTESVISKFYCKRILHCITGLHLASPFTFHVLIYVKPK